MGLLISLQLYVYFIIVTIFLLYILLFYSKYRKRNFFLRKISLNIIKLHLCGWLFALNPNKVTKQAHDSAMHLTWNYKWRQYYTKCCRKAFWCQIRTISQMWLLAMECHLILLRFFLGIFIIIDHSCLKNCIFTKLSLIICLNKSFF